MGQRLPVPARNSSMEPALSISGAFSVSPLGPPRASMALNDRILKLPGAKTLPQAPPRPGTSASLNSRRLKRLERRLPGQVLFLVFCGRGGADQQVSPLAKAPPLQISDTATAHLNLCSLLLIKARSVQCPHQAGRGIFLGRPGILSANLEPPPVCVAGEGVSTEVTLGIQQDSWHYPLLLPQARTPGWW